MGREEARQAQRDGQRVLEARDALRRAILTGKLPPGAVLSQSQIVQQLQLGRTPVREEVIVIGGDVAHADEALLAGIREVVYQRSTPLATRAIRVVRSALDDDRAGIIGAAVMAIEAILEPAAVDQALAAG